MTNGVDIDTTQTLEKMGRDAHTRLSDMRPDPTDRGFALSHSGRRNLGAMQLSAFLPAGTPALALPDWRNPRIILPTGLIRTVWRLSGLYPAFRLSARLYRHWQRVKITATRSRARKTGLESWPLGAFTRDVLPPAASVVVLAGTPGPAQKAIVQLWNAQGKILGYLKYAEQPAARSRLLNERDVLSGLPDSLATSPLKFGALGDGMALLVSPVPGSMLKARLPPPKSFRPFLDKFIVSGPTAIDTHAWVRGLRPAVMEEAKPMLSALAGRSWPVVVQHGDFTPWNILKESGGPLRALDWEYGSLRGFPYLDLAFYVLQVAALMHRWPPGRARDYAVQRLARAPWPALKPAEALAIVQLTALDAYWKGIEDGHSDDAPLQLWRREIWKTAP